MQQALKKKIFIEFDNVSCEQDDKGLKGVEHIKLKESLKEQKETDDGRKRLGGREWQACK